MGPDRAGLSLPQPLFEEIERWARKAYPHEGCGVLTGRFGSGGGKKASAFVPLRNLLLDSKEKLAERVERAGGVISRERAESGEGRTEFLIDPSELERASRAAETRGEDVIGIVHTHPDHPPRPSPTDASQPMLAGWSNVIVAVQGGNAVEARSWVRDEETAPFDEERISILKGDGER